MTQRLDEFDMIEWWDVARRLNPRMTWEEFEADWTEFVRLQMHKARANDGMQTSRLCMGSRYSLCGSGFCYGSRLSVG